MDERKPWVTADSLIEAFGDEAYEKGLRMAVEALQAGDPQASRDVAAANLDLIRRGYHKRVPLSAQFRAAKLPTHGDH